MSDDEVAEVPEGSIVQVTFDGTYSHYNEVSGHHALTNPRGGFILVPYDAKFTILDDPEKDAIGTIRRTGADVTGVNFIRKKNGWICLEEDVDITHAAARQFPRVGVVPGSPAASEPKPRV